LCKNVEVYKRSDFIISVAAYLGTRETKSRINESKREKILQLIQMIIENGGDMNAEDEKGDTPLSMIIKKMEYSRNDMCVVDILRTYGAKFYTESGLNVLCLAYKSEEVMAYILQHEPTLVNIPDKSGELPLHRVLKNAMYHENSVINFLFDKGLDVTSDTKCVELAADNEWSFEIIETLITHGAPFNMNEKKRRGLLLCRYGTNPSNVKKMLEWGADATIDLGAYSSVLEEIVKNCKENSLEVVKLLIAAGANPIKDGSNVLHTACETFAQSGQEHLIPLIEFLCSLPEYTDLNNKYEFDLIHHPQTEILERFHEFHRDEAVRVMTAILKTNFTEPKFSVPCALNLTVKGCSLFEHYFLTAFGSILNTEDIEIMLDDDSKNLMKLMFDRGFKVPDAECDRVTTALTALLAVSLPCDPNLYFLEEEEEEKEDAESDDKKMQDLPLEQTSNETLDQDIEEHSESSDVEESDSAMDEDEMWAVVDEEQEEDYADLTLDDARNKISELMQLVREFIEAGVNVESMTLNIVEPTDKYLPHHTAVIAQGEMFDTLRRIMGAYDDKTSAEKRSAFKAWCQPMQQKLWLPDALWVAFLSGNGPAVKMLLPHWSAPPLALLLFMPELNAFDLAAWYPFLSKYGAIPHGTEVYKKLTSLLQDLHKNHAKHDRHFININVLDGLWNNYQDLHSE
jgi:hypothetical protein